MLCSIETNIKISNLAETFLRAGIFNPYFAYGDSSIFSHNEIEQKCHFYGLFGSYSEVMNSEEQGIKKTKLETFFENL